MSVDPVWAEYYRDNMDAAGLHRVLGGFERPAARRGIFERHVAVANAHVEWALDTKVQEDLGVRPPSAAPLTDAQQRAVEEALNKVVGRKVQLSLAVDPSLIGGMVVKVGSRMVDSSVKTQLQRLKLAMKGAA